MRTRNKILAAGGGLLGSALLAVTLTSPSTLATWSNDINLDSATITSGNLEVAPLGNMAWSDASDPANPVSIDLNTYKIVPGDTITSEQNIDMALEGDNILASFDLDFALASSGDLLAGLEITYDIVDENGVEVVPETAYDTAATQFIVGENDVTPDLDSTKDYTVRIKVVFPDTTANRDYTEVNAILNSAQVHVKQVRSGGVSTGGTGGGTTTPVTTLGYKVDLANSYSLVVQSDGTVKSWGKNTQGQLGLGNNTNTLTPTLIPGLSNVKTVHAGYYSSFAVLNDGSVYGWGGNTEGQLGLGHSVSQTSPVLLPISNVKQIQPGSFHVLALFNDGTVKSTGYNNYGQLGLGNNSIHNVFTTIAGLSNIESLAASSYSSMAVNSNGDVKTWGYNNLNQLGDGTSVNKYSPVSISINDVKTIKCGYSHCFAIQNDNDVYGWGSNGSGHLGFNGVINVSTPTLFNALGSIDIIQPGYNSTYVKTTSGDHYLWGNNSYGVLGNGNQDTLFTPTITSVVQGNDVFYSSTFDHFSLVNKTDGSWVGWGHNNYGQIGLVHANTPVLTPQILSTNPM